jgi:hypothetical protein
MTDNRPDQMNPFRPSPRNDRPSTDSIVRWVFWIVVAAVTIWVFADLLIRH